MGAKEKEKGEGELIQREGMMSRSNQTSFFLISRDQTRVVVHNGLHPKQLALFLVNSDDIFLFLVQSRYFKCMSVFYSIQNK